MRTKLICTFITALLAVCTVQATTLPAPIWHTITFVDGSSKELRLMGSQHMFGIKTKQAASIYKTLTVNGILQDMKRMKKSTAE